MKHDLELRSFGRGIEGWIAPFCSCGWVESKHYNHNDYQHSNAKEEHEWHVKGTEQCSRVNH